MNHTRNKAIIRTRLAGGKSMTGVELNQPGPENATGMIETMALMIKNGDLTSENGAYSLRENDSVQWDGGDPVPYEAIAKACEGRPNMLVAIGWKGVKSCYLNISVDSAIARYKDEYGDADITGVPCEIIAFHDSFHSYEVSE